MRKPRIRVVLADPQDVAADLVVLPGSRPRSAPGERTIQVRAPRWRPRGGEDHLLAQAYRDSLAAATDRGARSLVLPGILARGVWPMEDVTRIALTVLLSTPSTVQEVTIAAAGPGTLERWAEALAREL